MCYPCDHCNRCGRIPPAGTCINCGHVNPPGVVVCEECGFSYPAPPGSPIIVNEVPQTAAEKAEQN